MPEYDSLVANGILPMPVKDILNKNLPLPSQIPHLPNAGLNTDVYTPSSPQKSSFNWGKWILGGFVATAAVLGLRKGYKGLSGFLNKFKPANIKTTFSNGFTYVKNAITGLFKKKP